MVMSENSRRKSRVETEKVDVRMKSVGPLLAVVSRRRGATMEGRLIPRQRQMEGSEKTKDQTSGRGRKKKGAS